MSIFYHCTAHETGEDTPGPSSTLFAASSAARSASHTPHREAVLLDRHGVYSRELKAGERVLLEGLEGLFWVTMEGDRMDYAVEPGQPLHLLGPGLLLIEGLHAANAMAVHR